MPTLGKIKTKLVSGFTLIELLVSIAIIMVLASVVIVTINEARDKNADAAIKQALSGIPAQSELYAHANGLKYYINGTNNLCSSSASGSAYNIVLNAARNYGLSSITVNNTPLGQTSLTRATCNTVVNAWAVEVPLRNKNIGGTGKSNMFCVDSTGFIGTRSTSMGAGATACPSE